MRNGFHRIDNGYGCPADYIGFGYAIINKDNYGDLTYEIYNIEDCIVSDDPNLGEYVEPVEGAIMVEERWTQKDAREWCKHHPRDL